MNSMIPVLAISGSSINVFLYDCVNDVLLELAQPVKYRDGTHLLLDGIVLLWAVLNHRQYLHCFPPEQDIVSSRFHAFQARRSASESGTARPNR